MSPEEQEEEDSCLHVCSALDSQSTLGSVRASLFRIPHLIVRKNDALSKKQAASAFFLPLDRAVYVPDPALAGTWKVRETCNLVITGDNRGYYLVYRAS